MLFFFLGLQRVVNAWIVARHQLLYGDEMATAIICATLVDFTTKWMARTGHSSSQNANSRHLAEKERFVAIAKLQPRLYGDEITAANLFAMLVDSTLSCIRLLVPSHWKKKTFKREIANWQRKPKMLGSEVDSNPRCRVLKWQISSDLVHTLLLQLDLQWVPITITQQ